MLISTVDGPNKNLSEGLFFKSTLRNYFKKIFWLKNHHFIEKNMLGNIFPIVSWECETRSIIGNDSTEHLPLGHSVVFLLFEWLDESWTINWTKIWLLYCAFTATRNYWRDVRSVKLKMIDSERDSVVGWTRPARIWILMGTTMMNTNTHVVSAPIATYLVRNGSRVEYANEFQFINIKSFFGLLRWYCIHI